NITGLTLPMDWSFIDNCTSALKPCSQQGLAYNWTNFDATFAPYTVGPCFTGHPSPCTCAGGVPCKINFEVNAATGATANSATPPYVFSDTPNWAASCPSVGKVPACTSTTTPVDVCFCSAYTGLAGSPSNTCVNARTPSSNTSGVPASWETPFQSAYLGFVQQVIQHYSTVSWHSQVGYIRFGMGVGGGGALPCYQEETGTVGTPPTPPLNLSIWGVFASNLFSYATQ